MLLRSVRLTCRPGPVAVEKPDYSEAKIVVAMVGLPARGKSYLSNKLQRYLLVRTPPCLRKNHHSWGLRA